ncbi:MAG: DUF427 domain-containing protein [Candidatus Saccharimonadales bacterium]
MKAVWNDQVIAEANKSDLIRIEGNWYFPTSSINKKFFAESNHRTECMWKGTASYYDVAVDGKLNESAAWFYANPMDGSIQKVGKDYTNFVAFWHGVEVIE